MIGPSAPNGPPEPIEMAEESGFKIASRGSGRAVMLDLRALGQDGGPVLGLVDV